MEFGLKIRYNKGSPKDFRLSIGFGTKIRYNKGLPK
jgi:hypothetical protein